MKLMNIEASLFLDNVSQTKRIFAPLVIIYVL